MPIILQPDVDRIIRDQAERDQGSLKSYNPFSGQLKVVTKAENGKSFLVRKTQGLTALVAQWLSEDKVNPLSTEVARITALGAECYVAVALDKLTHDGLLQVWNGVRVPDKRIQGEGDKSEAIKVLLLEACLELNWVRSNRFQGYVTRSYGVAFPPEIRQWRTAYNRWLEIIHATPGGAKANPPELPEVVVKVPWYPEFRRGSWSEKKTPGKDPTKTNPKPKTAPGKPNPDEPRDPKDLAKKGSPGPGARRTPTPPPAGPPAAPDPGGPGGGGDPGGGGPGGGAPPAGVRMAAARPKLNDYETFEPFKTRPDVFVDSFTIVASVQGYDLTKDNDVKVVYQIFKTRMREQAAVWIQKKMQ